MKSVLLSIGILLTGLSFGRAQANFAFQNNGTGQLIMIDNLDDTNGPVPIGGNNAMAASLGAGPGQVTFRLYAGTNGMPVVFDPFFNQVLSGLVLVGTTTNLGSTAAGAVGLFNGGNPFVMPAPFDGSFPIQFMYTAQTANTLFFWHSSLATGYNLATGAAPITASFGLGANQVQGFTLVNPIPEPSSLSLVGIGFAVMLFFRRRNGM